MSNAASRRVLVTGANGFVGRAVVRELASLPECEVVAAVRSLDKFAVRNNARVVASATGDIGPETDWSSALKGVQTVIHLAARVHVMNEQSENPLEAFRVVNVQATLNLARQSVAAGVRRFVFVSSVKVNGERGHFTERDAPHPGDPYGVSKLGAEVGLQQMARDTGLEVVIVRPPLVYGPGVKANFQSLMQLVSRGFPLPFGAVHNRRSFVAVENLAHFLAVCATHPAAAGQTFLVSDGNDLSTTALLRAMGRALQKPVRLIPVPALLLKSGLTILGKGAIADRLFGNLTVDISKAKTLLQWTPPLSTDEALQRTVAADVRPSSGVSRA